MYLYLPKNSCRSASIFTCLPIFILLNNNLKMPPTATMGISYWYTYRTILFYLLGTIFTISLSTISKWCKNSNLDFNNIKLKTINMWIYQYLSTYFAKLLTFYKICILKYYFSRHFTFNIIIINNFYVLIFHIYKNVLRSIFS